MTRQCNDIDFEIIYSIINDAAEKYKKAQLTPNK